LSPAQDSLPARRARGTRAVLGCAGGVWVKRRGGGEGGDVEPVLATRDDKSSNPF